MTKALSPEKRIAVLVAALAAIIGAVLLTNAIPPVVGLGDKVRLPIFHGGSTWVNLGAFTLLGLFALSYLVTGRRDLYRWAVGFRVVAASLWIINTVMGMIAAMQTWDFTGSAQSPLIVAQADPRLMAQVQLLLLIVGVLILDWLLDNDHWKAVIDVAYVAGMWWLLGTVLSSPEARALHPDNPVLNSGSEIQLPFFAIVGALSLGVILFAWLVRDRMVRAE
jgi:hypothetical protein